MADPFVGEIRRFAGNYAPEGWQLCDGRMLRIAEYAELFAVIGTRFGGREDAFALPNLNQQATSKGEVAYIIATAGRKPRQPGEHHEQSNYEAAVATVHDGAAHSDRLRG